MRHNYLNPLAILFYLSTISISIFSGFRDTSVGKDTAEYTFFYNHIHGYDSYKNFEILFFNLSKFLATLGLNSSWFFSFITLSITLLYLYAFSKSSRAWNKAWGALSLYTLLLLSDWYLVETTNGLRQGIALAILYIALAFFGDKKRLLFIFIFLLALGFHASVILIIPFLPLYFISLKRLSYLYFVMVILSVTEVFEHCIKITSTILNLGIYERIKYYGSSPDFAEFYGYRADIFLYSVFWVCFFIFSRRLLRRKYSHRFNLILKNFIILSLPYLVLGFGGFSNRYAVIAWFYLPLVQASFISFIKLPYNLKYIPLIIIFPFAIMKYIISVY